LPAELRDGVLKADRELMDNQTEKERPDRLDKQPHREEFIKVKKWPEEWDRTRLQLKILK
jgi:hypothetical protein